MLDWNAAKEAIRLAVVAATGVQSNQVVWEDGSKSGTWIKYPQIRLKQRRVKAWDDSVIVTSEGVGQVTNMVLTHSGPRQLSIQIKVESNNANKDDATTVLSEYIRTRLYRSAILSALLEAGVGIGAMGETFDSTYTDSEGRSYTVGITEIDFNLIQNDRDETDSGDFIQSVGFVSDTFKGPDGTDSPNQIDVTISKP